MTHLAHSYANCKMQSGALYIRHLTKRRIHRTGTCVGLYRSCKAFLEPFRQHPSTANGFRLMTATKHREGEELKPPIAVIVFSFILGVCRE